MKFLLPGFSLTLNTSIDYSVLRVDYDTERPEDERLSTKPLGEPTSSKGHMFFRSVGEGWGLQHEAPTELAAPRTDLM